MQLHTLKRNTKRKKSVSVGRGGKRGKTAGRGTKGQKARAGRKLRPEIRDTIKKLPKLRGYAFNSVAKKPVAITLSAISSFYKDGETVSRDTLREKKVIPTYKGQFPSVKLLSGKTPLTVKISVSGIVVSGKAKEEIEKLGGSIVSSK